MYICIYIIYQYVSGPVETTNQSLGMLIAIQIGDPCWHWLTWPQEVDKGRSSNRGFGAGSHCIFDRVLVRIAWANSPGELFGTPQVVECTSDEEEYDLVPDSPGRCGVHGGVPTKQ